MNCYLTSKKGNRVKNYIYIFSLTISLLLIELFISIATVNYICCYSRLLKYFLLTISILLIILLSSSIYILVNLWKTNFKICFMHILCLFFVLVSFIFMSIFSNNNNCDCSCTKCHIHNNKEVIELKYSWINIMETISIILSIIWSSLGLIFAINS